MKIKFVYVLLVIIQSSNSIQSQDKKSGKKFTYKIELQHSKSQGNSPRNYQIALVLRIFSAYYCPI